MTAIATAPPGPDAPHPSGEPLVDRRLVRAWFTATLFWTIVAPVLGLLASMKLDDPTFLADVHWLQFARLRIAHVNGVIFGLFSTAIFGFMCYAVPKLCGRPIVNVRSVWWGMGLFNLAVLLGEGCLLHGILQPVEAGEYPRWVDVLLIVAYLLCAVPMLQTIVLRRVDRMYVSLWYWTAGLLWTAINVPLGTFVLPSTPGVTAAAMHGFYLHNVVGLWITPMGLGVVYYLVPAASRNTLFSHKLSLIGFWGLAFFYPLNGIHHYIYSPIAEWAQTIAIAASMMLILPVWAFSINVWGTMRGQWGKWATDNVVLKFSILGAVWYLITCFQGPTQALRGMQALTHFGDYNVGHAHSAVFGAFAIWAWAGLYYVLPRVFGVEVWSKSLALWHYWLEIFGFTLMFTALTISGFVQGHMLLSADPLFTETLQQIKPYWLARTLGGTLMDVGLALFVFNMVMTLLVRRRSGPPDVGVYVATSQPAAQAPAAASV